MNDERRQDERISAYLDGQLPSEERERFEKEMAADATLAAAVDELRKLTELVASAPRHQLDADFSQRVLQAAHRALISGEYPAGATSGGPNRLKEQRRLLNVRGVLWAGIATACAVILSVTTYERYFEPRQVVRAPDANAPDSAKSDFDTKAKKRLDFGASWEADRSSGADVESTNKLVESKTAEESPEGAAFGAERFVDDPADALRPRAEAAIVPNRTNETADSDGEGTVHDGVAGRGFDKRLGESVEPAAPAPPGDRMDAPQPQQRRGMRGAVEPGDRDVAPNEFIRPGSAAKKTEVGDPVPEPDVKDLEEEITLAAPPVNTVVVAVDITAQGAERNSNLFFDVLRRYTSNQEQNSEAGEGEPLASAGGTKNRDNNESELAPAETRKSEEDLAKDEASSLTGRGSLARERLALDDAGKMQVVEMVVSFGQLKSMFAAMQSQPDRLSNSVYQPSAPLSLGVLRSTDDFMRQIDPNSDRGRNSAGRRMIPAPSDGEADRPNDAQRREKRPTEDEKMAPSEGYKQSEAKPEKAPEEKAPDDMPPEDKAPEDNAPEDNAAEDNAAPDAAALDDAGVDAPQSVPPAAPRAKPNAYRIAPDDQNGRVLQRQRDLRSVEEALRRQASAAIDRRSLSADAYSRQLSMLLDETPVHVVFVIRTTESVQQEAASEPVAPAAEKTEE